MNSIEPTLLRAVFVSCGVLSIVSCGPRHLSNDDMRARMSQDFFTQTAKPHVAQRLLDPLVGSWKTVTRILTGIEGNTKVAEGQADTRWVLDGLFLQEDVIASSFNPASPMRGLGLIGYDAVSNTYTSVWMDNRIGQIAISNGTVDSTGRVFTFTGRFNDPIRQREVTTRQVLAIVSNESHTLDMYERVGDQPETKVFEAVYTRRMQ